ncbi:DUF2793 domain-containing protein [Altericroceibacterium spongiae]|uniref:DUF2793 domain-containing protein n=1 Tax=Altericroceibacterium spongiae TaxID=2320269 RepID=A0A420EIM0_9SPHN|nr:DUF2793 domain-containing protein [Altericroceibacterium spongiae]RKF20572.1 DUF2793 domain-containing protein [Altericroceibacterium spongiae]
MPDPLSFTSTSPRFGLPMLFAGQAQKEFFVNEAHSRTDALLHAAIEAEQAEPPTFPEDGQCWLIGPDASGEWVDREGTLACWQAGSWLFIPPRDGMSLLDRSSGQIIRYAGGWKRPSTVTGPSGGDTVDSEARAAIAGLIASLIDAGIFPNI